MTKEEVAAAIYHAIEDYVPGISANECIGCFVVGQKDGTRFVLEVKAVEKAKD